MKTGGLRKVLEHVHQALRPRAGGGLTDGQLLARFVAAHDESAFAALVARHGPMVLGVCRRVLRHEQDAEDAFQAAFLVLARKAGSVVKRESVGSWLYAVAYRAALEARSANARRQAHERQVKDLPHPLIAPVEPQDWRPLLDHELQRLPEKYRVPVVLCDLEGLPRREAAHRLGLAEGTLSSRLATARQLLARRLTRYGVSLSGGALATALAEGASAALPPTLVAVTSKAALLVAAGQLATVATPAAALTRGVLKVMFLAKLKVVVVLALVAGLGASGVAYRAAGQSAAPADKRASKPASELEALRTENELLKLNLRVVLEKLRAQETEVLALRAQAKAKTTPQKVLPMTLRSVGQGRYVIWNLDRNVKPRPAAPDPVQEVEAALKALRAARDAEAKRRAVEALQKATKKLQDGLKPASPGPGGDPRKPTPR
jgi:RNA polymerase sigma factor (sigma-70 family)